MSDRTGGTNPNWRGGRVVEPRGYVLLRLPDHPRADVRGYVYEHIVVAEQKLGRAILPGEEVHHRDENKSNNHPDNLIVAYSKAEHRLFHRKRDRGLRLPGEDNPLIDCACGCGEQLRHYDSSGRPRTFVRGHNPQPAPTTEAVIGCLMIGTIHRQAISELTGIPVRNVASALSKLHREGLVRNSGEGYWTWREHCLV